MSIEFFRDLTGLQNNKIVDQPKLRAFADGKIKVTQKSKLVFAQVENIVGRREDACCGVFFLKALTFEHNSITLLQMLSYSSRYTSLIFDIYNDI